jgi:uncharacterized protein (DUF2252 family)
MHGHLVQMLRQTVAERSASGRAQRTACPRSSHGALELGANRDPRALLQAQDATRVPELVPIRRERMSESAFAFYRGAATVMAHDLAAQPATSLHVQLCGDAHLGNFGGFASPERSLVFDVNDFDETFPGPFEWDVKRLVASFEIAGRQSGFADADRATAVTTAVQSYREAMRGFAGLGDLAVWYSRLDVDTMLAEVKAEGDRKTTKTLQHAITKARSHDDTRALASYTTEVDGERRIVSEPPLIVPMRELPHGEDTEKQLRAAFNSYRRTLPRERRVLLDRFAFVDLARKVVGVGSVGTRCWMVLLHGRDDADPLFLQIKEAGSSVLEPLLGGTRSQANHGQRVVEGQRLMQAASDIFLGWVRAEVDGAKRDYYVRQLRDWKMSPDIDSLQPGGLVGYAKACGWTLARAHARSGDPIAIASYLGSGDVFDRAIAEFASAYADVNERDYRAFTAQSSKSAATRIPEKP